MSLQLRVTVGLLVVVAVSAVLFCFWTVSLMGTDLMAATTDQLKVAVAKDVAGGPPSGSIPPPTGDSRGLPTAHLVVGPSGETLVAEPAGPVDDPEPLPQLNAEDIVTLRSGTPVIVGSGSGDLRYLLLADSTDPQRLEIEAAPLTEIDAAVAALRGRLLLGGLVITLLAGAAVLLTVRRGLRPLREVVAVADSVTGGAREVAVPQDSGPKEIRHLATAMNRMLEQQERARRAQEASEQRLRRFVSDAAHELQTPVTSIRGWSHLCLSDELNPQESREALERVNAAGRRMGGLVDQMLVLARMDDHRNPPRQVVDISEIARDAVAEIAIVDPARPWTVDAPRPALVLADPGQIRRIVDNLLRNVLVHTPPASAARISVHDVGEWVDLRVEDCGDGLSPQALEHAWDRFWRADPSRSEGSCGLGLSICAAVAESLGGSVRAYNSSSGAVFAVTLPARVAPGRLA